MDIKKIESLVEELKNTNTIDDDSYNTLRKFITYHSHVVFLKNICIENRTILVNKINKTRGWLKD